jgi:hypothetical protein
MHAGLTAHAINDGTGLSSCLADTLHESAFCEHIQTRNRTTGPFWSTELYIRFLFRRPAFSQLRAADAALHYDGRERS